MSKYFRLQLTVILIVFSLFISFVIVLFDYGKLRENIEVNHEVKIEMVEDAIMKSLSSIDKAYLYFDKTRADDMEKHSEEMLEMYTKDPTFKEWDFELLKEKFGMDIYIINTGNVVVHSSFIEDVGLDFEKCCKSFANLLDDRRASNVFHHDAMDIQQHTGEMKKFSYMPTPDQKYILELGVLLEDDELFNHFNFMTTIEELINDYGAIKSIHVYNSGGYYLGYQGVDNVPLKLDDWKGEIFKDAVKSGQVKEVKYKLGQEYVTSRYIPYMAEEKQGLSTTRVVEIISDDAELDGILDYYRNEFISQIIIIVIGAIALSFIIARLIAKPIYLAFHDSLTGLKNRAAFEDEIKKRLASKKGLTALMMIDLDDFKSVNDLLGHSEGDRLLIKTGDIIREVAGLNNVASRIGGDEFVVVFTGVGKKEIKEIAELMIENINHELSTFRADKSIHVSISIGIAYSIDGDEVNTLYDRADKALYISKKNGKNQYTLYNGE